MTSVHERYAKEAERHMLNSRSVNTGALVSALLAIYHVLAELDQEVKSEAEAS